MPQRRRPPRCRAPVPSPEPRFGRSRGKSLEQRWAKLAQFFESLELLELCPEVPGDARRGTRRRGEDLIDETQQRSAEVPSLQPGEGRVLRLEHRVFERWIVEYRFHEPRDVERVSRVVEHAAAVHRRRHRRRCVRQDGNSFVEGLDNRDAEPLVSARAQEKIGDVVERRQLLVRDVTEEVHVRSAEGRDEFLQHRQVPFEAAVRADEQQARARVVPRAVDVERANDGLELLVWNHPSDEHHVRPLVVKVCGQERARWSCEVAEAGHHR